MDINEIFNNFCDKLNSDFKISMQINHKGSKGSYRESVIKNFLEPLLPQKYGLGKGEIIGHTKNVSKQADIIIYNKLEFTPLLVCEDMQVFPIESLYGIIEVKSQLSKETLIDGLENIKSTKMLSPKDLVTVSTMPGFYSPIKRPIPFGIIFSYSLAENSLESLVENLTSWEKENSREFWPNLIVILNEGIILHNGSIDKPDCYTNEDIINHSLGVRGIPHKEKTLLQFYSILIDLCNNMTLGPLKLHAYSKPYEKIGSFIVRMQGNLISESKNTSVRLTERFIKQVYEHCKNRNKISYKDHYNLAFGRVPPGIENAKILKGELHLYDPEDLAKNYSEQSSHLSVDLSNPFLNSLTIEINYEIFCIPLRYLTEEFTEACS